MSTAKKDKTTKRKLMTRQQVVRTIIYVLIAVAWVSVSFYASQFLGTWLMYWLLGNKIMEPAYYTLASAVVYGMTVALTVLVPWGLAKKQKAKRAAEEKQAKTAEKKQKLIELEGDEPLRDELGLKGLPTWKDLLLAPAGMVVYAILAGILTTLFTLLPWYVADQVQDTGFTNLVSTPDRIVAMIAIVILAPVAEELLFRGWLYGKLRRKLSIVPALLVVSVLFGIFHGQWNVGVDVFALSVVACALRELTGTIYAGILLHMIKNAVAFYLLFIMV